MQGLKMQSGNSRRLLVFLPIAALLFASMLLLVEHFSGGVQSHHLLNRSDLPAISNWFGLFTLPLLAVAFIQRVRASTHSARWAGIPLPILLAGLGAFLYGAILATTFTLDAFIMTQVVFLGLLVIAVVLPFYRAEYLFGFVLGMTFTLGGVLPLIVASLVALVLFAVRRFARATSLVRRAWGRNRRLTES